MSTEAYDIGDLRRFTVALTDVDEQPADPSALSLTILRPDGTTAVYTYGESPTSVVRESIGSFYVDIAIAQYGRHWAKWTATGALVLVDQFEFFARFGQV